MSEDYNKNNEEEQSIFDFLVKNASDNPSTTPREAKQIRENEAAGLTSAQMLDSANQRAKKENRQEFQRTEKQNEVINDPVPSYSNYEPQIETKSQAQEALDLLNRTRSNDTENNIQSSDDSKDTKEEFNEADFENPIDAIAASKAPLSGRYETVQKSVPQIENKVTEKQAENFNPTALSMLNQMNPPKDSDIMNNLTNALPGTSNHLSGNTLADDVTLLDTSKEVQIPVDIEFDNGKQVPSFNLEKTLRWHGFNNLANKFADMKPGTFQTPFFDNIAKKQYAKYQKRKNMTKEERQKTARKALLLKIFIPIIIIAAIILSIVPRVIKQKNLNSGFEAIAQQKYEIAEDIMCNKVKNPPYCVYAQALNQMSKNQYEEAYENLEKLIPYQQYIRYSVEETINEAKYQQAQHFLEGKQYVEGLELLREISNYKDAADIFYKTCYELAVTYDGKTDEIALKYFYMAKDYEDAKDKFSEVASRMYDKAFNLYSTSNFDEAQTIFDTLSKYRYRDSKTMYSQCIYKRALIAYQAGDYNTSNELFKQIKSFKDSSALIYDASQEPEYEVQLMHCLSPDAEDFSYSDTETEFGRIACRFTPESFEGTIVEVIPSTEEGVEDQEITSTYITLEDFNTALDDIAIKYDSPIKYEYTLDAPEPEEGQAVSFEDAEQSEENPEGTTEESTDGQSEDVQEENAQEENAQENAG